VITSRTAADILYDVAAVLAYHRDDFELDEDYQKMVNLLATTVAPLVGDRFNRGAFITVAMQRAEGCNAQAKYRERLSKRGEDAP
jgi:hypothetical protein